MFLGCGTLEDKRKRGCRHSGNSKGDGEGAKQQVKTIVALECPCSLAADVPEPQDQSDFCSIYSDQLSS